MTTLTTLTTLTTAPAARQRQARSVAHRRQRLLGGLIASLTLLLGGCATISPAPLGALSVSANLADAPVTSLAASPSKPLAALFNRSPSLIAPLSALTVVHSTNAGALSVATLSAPTDLWDRIRRGFAMPELENDLVRDRERWYASRPDHMQRVTERARKYLFHIVEELERRNMPLELALLPYIESSFNPQAVSSVRAAGLWQFMPHTGESFDLVQNVFRDDRRDVLASTNAALDYLQQLHKRFGDWHLALAAYNWGQGNVSRAITRNQRAGLPTGYAYLNMPMETRMYVPKLQAVANLIANPQAFGARLPQLGNHPFFDTVPIQRDMDVAVIARLAGIQEEDFRALNPAFKHPVVMAAATPQVLLPWDNAAVFQANLKTYGGQLASWTAWVVPSTLSAAQVAERVGMSEAELRRVNQIPPRMLVRAGSSLLVPRNGQHNRDVTAHVADNGHLSLQPEVVVRRSSVRVRAGDTLARLARRHGVTVAQVAGWNKLAPNARLQAGQRITLMLPARATPVPRAQRAPQARASRSSPPAARSP